MLQRVRELSVQAANGSYSANDRQAIQSEVAQLAAEIDRSANAAQFNGARLFDPSRASAVGDENQLAVFDGLTSVGSWLENSELLIQNLYGIESDGAALQINYTGFSDNAGGVAAYVQVSGFDGQGRGKNLLLQVDLADFAPPNLPNGGTGPFYNDRIVAHEMVHAVMARATNWQDITSNNLWFAEGTAEFIHGADERMRGDIANVGVAGVVAAINGPSNTSEFYSSSYSALRYMHSRIKAAGGEGVKDVLEGFAETFETIATSNGSTTSKVFQVGANANQTLETRVGAMGLDAMGLRNTLDVTQSPNQAIVAVDRALDYVNRQRALVGAQTSRMESAMVAQANQLPRGVLALLTR